MNDLIVLVADKDIEYTVKGLLQRHQALGMRDISYTYETNVHINRDNGCYTDSHEFLRSFSQRYKYALVIFDHDGCGAQALPEAIEQEVERKLSDNGWQNRASAIVIEPEIEAWVWAQSPHVEDVLGWKGRTPKLSAWLTAKGYITDTNRKPADPKSVMQEALRIATKGKSSSLFLELAQRVKFSDCQDRAFCKLQHTLQQWFGIRENS